MRVLLGGGTGFVGRHLRQLLVDNGYKVTVVSRQPGPDKLTWKDISRDGIPDDVTAVVNVAGENILNPLKRWNDNFKQAVRSSRVDTNKLLADAIVNSTNKPNVFATISGVAIYMPLKNQGYRETDTSAPYDYLSDLTHDWEIAAKLPDSVKTRQVVVRSGVVLGRDGGMIQQIYYPFFFNLGGTITLSGAQWFPWIHVDDISGIFLHAIKNDNVTGVLNGVAPDGVTNREFTKAFAKEMWRLSHLPIPGFIMKAVYGKERAKIILEGQRVVPERTIESGYEYKYPDILSACKNLAPFFKPKS